MKILATNVNRKIKCVATIGGFDGIHKGHLYLLNRLKAVAAKHKLPTVIITFWPLPSQALFFNFLGCLTNLEQKIKILEAMQEDYFFILKTNERLLNWRGKTFLQKITDKLDIKELVVGEDFGFGRNRENDLNDLKKMSGDFGFKITTVKKYKRKQKVISSSSIRELIKIGKVDQVKALLGRNYILSGKVIKGQGVGRRLGFPTLNINPGPMIVPAYGVYKVKAQVNGTEYLGACNIGFNPTVGPTAFANVEVHLIDIQARKIPVKGPVSLEFLRRIRSEKKFSSRDKLKQAIAKDIIRIKTA
jgi:riboflavin kinase / FMN adenylyltransferase